MDYTLPGHPDPKSVKGRIVTLEFESLYLVGTYVVNAGTGLKVSKLVFEFQCGCFPCCDAGLSPWVRIQRAMSTVQSWKHQRIPTGMEMENASYRTGVTAIPQGSNLILPSSF